MRKSFIVSAIIFLAVTTAVIFACNSEDKSKETTSTTSSEDSAKASIERGKYLAIHVAQCIDCHSQRDVTKFAMPVIPGTEGGGSGFPFGKGEGVPGEVWAPNITPFGLKDWSDNEILRAVTQGINKKGDTLFPLMPYHSFSRMAKDDLNSIIAYLRTLKSIDSTKPPRHLLIPPAMFGPLPQTTLDQNIRPDPSDKVRYGEYMITIALCGECHTPRSPQGVPDFSKVYAGGFAFNTPFFKVTVSNITPDSATGIGTWTEEAFIQKFKTNSSVAMVNTNPGRQNTIMPWEAYGKMKEGDLRAIYAYLRTVPPVQNKIEKWATK